MKYSLGDTVYISGIPYRVYGCLPAGYILREKIPPFRSIALPIDWVDKDDRYKSDLPYNHRY